MDGTDQVLLTFQRNQTSALPGEVALQGGGAGGV
jgi:hypothetical protein